MPGKPDADIAFGIDARFQSDEVNEMSSVASGSISRASHSPRTGYMTVFDIVIAVGPFRNDAQADVDLTVRKK